jgi:hypothetical protein
VLRTGSERGMMPEKWVNIPDPYLVQYEFDPPERFPDAENYIQIYYEVKGKTLRVSGNRQIILRPMAGNTVHIEIDPE